MIITEYYRTLKNGIRLVRSVSDKGLCIRKISTNEVYGVAIDIESTINEYEEIDMTVKEYKEVKNEQSILS